MSKAMVFLALGLMIGADVLSVSHDFCFECTAGLWFIDRERLMGCSQSF